MAPTASLLSGGRRLHLQHGPIDLIVGADGDRHRAFAAAQDRFTTILQELMAEIALLRVQVTTNTPTPQSPVARRMDKATRPYAADTFVTRMVAVAGSVADEVLGAMTADAVLTRAFVNNGGDIALHLGAGQTYTTAIASHDGHHLGQVKIDQSDQIGGIASSGRHGRSLSLGIADNVTVLASCAAKADVAATLIANAVDLPENADIARRPANTIVDDSDLGDHLAVTGVGALYQSDIDHALHAGLTCATDFVERKRIAGAALFLQGESRATRRFQFLDTQRISQHA